MLWLLNEPERLPVTILEELADSNNIPVFSSLSIWEISIKSAQRKPDFQIDPAQVRLDFTAEGLEELAFNGQHAVAVHSLPAIHKDPFDRALVAQATVEGIKLITSDKLLAAYGDIVRLI